jgi:5-hydroxyisourate hydrolase
MSARPGLSTHVLDLTRGQPAAGMTIELWFAGAHVTTVVTNADGRTDAPLVEADTFAAGTYELIFHVGDYFDRVGPSSSVAGGGIAGGSTPGGPADRFLDRVPIRFTIRDTQARYHVPLLCTPWAYSTYRGS